MYENFVGQWVELTLVNGKKWIGRVEEADEDAVFISNGNAFGAAGHKGAECTNDEVESLNATEAREFFVE